MISPFLKNVPGHFRFALAAAALATLFAGCATAKLETAGQQRPFNFRKDTFAYPNEPVREYSFDTNGNWTSYEREPKPDYSHRGFVLARATKQFFQHARFAPEKPLADDETYRKVIRDVVSRSDSDAGGAKIVIPGYPNLRDFSEAEEILLKEECGGAWRNDFQRGHWRILFPFSRHNQKTTSQALIESISRNHLAVVHLIRFPQLTINHAVVLFEFRDTGTGIEFSAYDPNKPDEPAKLVFDRTSQTFSFPANDYFIGGKVNVYEVYRSCFY